MIGAAAPLLAARGISKSFSGVAALHNVDAAFQPGEVVAVVGANGAGKSTLMKILAGIYQPDTGALSWRGQEIALASAQAARRLGISIIHQELNLFDNLSVEANITIGREARRARCPALLDFAANRNRAAAALSWLGCTFAPHTRVSDLSLGQKQLVEIARALADDAQLIIMDEPTSSLSHLESERLFAVIRSLRTRGVAIIYISHRLAEVQAIADRAIVLRDGRKSAEFDRTPIARADLVNAMIGGAAAAESAPRRALRTGRPAAGQPILAAKDLIPAHGPRVPLSFEICAGEVVGLAGLIGSGRTELIETIFGIAPPRGGRLTVAGRTAVIDSPRAALAHSIALVPEDRKAHGIIADLPLSDNLLLPTLQRFARRRLLQPRIALRTAAAKITAALGIRCSSVAIKIGRLSGGNQQKAVIGRWLETNPALLLLDEPTRGVDIGSKAEIYRLIETLADQGLAIMLASSELEEIRALSDRVLVFHQGRIAAELAPESATEHTIMHYATGGGEQ